MPWDGGGNFTREHDWTDDANSSIDIEATRMDEEDDNFATGIEACLNKDGQNTAERVNVDNLRLDGNTLSSENTNGDINITPNGTGQTVTKNPVGDIAVSTTTSGGTAGINYDVADWPSTLTSGWTYYARAHTTSQGSYSIDPGGGAITVLEPGGDASKPCDWPGNTVMGFYYDGTNLIQTFIPKRPIFRTSASTSTDAWTRLARVTLTAQNAFCMLELRLDNISRRYGMDVICELFQSASLGSPPSGFVLTKMVTGESNTIFMHDKAALHYSTVNGTESVVDVYWTGGGSSLAQSDLDSRRITIQDSANVRVQFYESQGTATEASITSGSFNVTSQAAVGEVVENTTFSLGGDLTGSARLIAVRASSGYQVTLYVDDCSHSASSAPSSSLTAIPSSYRPSRTEWNCYHADAAAVKMIRATSGGAIQYDYTEWDGTGVTPTNTNTATISYYVSD